jgi:anti-anti-sigma factor
MLEIKKRTVDQIVVIDLAGRIDGSDSCREIHDVFKESLDDGIRKFVVDFQNVGWINSLGVGFLAAAAVSASNQDAVVRLTGMTSRVGSVLRACGVVPHVWKDFTDEEAAVASFN